MVNTEVAQNYHNGVSAAGSKGTRSMKRVESTMSETIVAESAKP